MTATFQVSSAVARVRPARRPWFTLSAYAWSAALLSVHAAICVVALPVTCVADRDRRFAARLGAALTRFGLGLCADGRAVVGALRRVRLDRPAVVVMNHRSLTDVPLAVAVPGAPRIVAKAWVARLPLLGVCMRLCGHVAFDPRDRRSVRAMVARAEALLARGESVLFFPEGTRRVGPGLGPFREGAFRIAVRRGVDVLPVVLHGTGDLAPKGALVLRRARFRAEVLPRIAPGDDATALARRVRSAMAAALGARA